MKFRVLVLGHKICVAHRLAAAQINKHSQKMQNSTQKISEVHQIYLCFRVVKAFKKLHVYFLRHNESLSEVKESWAESKNCLFYIKNLKMNFYEMFHVIV